MPTSPLAVAVSLPRSPSTMYSIPVTVSLTTTTRPITYQNLTFISPPGKLSFHHLMASIMQARLPSCWELVGAGVHISWADLGRPARLVKKREFEKMEVRAAGHLFISAREEGKVGCRECGERAEGKGRNERDEEDKEEKEEKVYICKWGGGVC